MTTSFIKRCRYIAISGALIIWLIKLVIRPSGLFDHTFAGFFLGIAPNLIGSFLIPFFACWLFANKTGWLARFFPVHHITGLRLLCLQSLVLLIVNEYLQKIRFFGRTFDYYDMLFSAAGLVTAYFIFAARLQRIPVPEKAVTRGQLL